VTWTLTYPNDRINERTNPMSFDHTATTIQMPYLAFKELNDKLGEMEREIRNLNDRATTVPGLTGVTELTTALPGSNVAELANAAMRVIQFAIGTLDPATVRGWPWSALRRFGESLKTFPVEQTMLDFADECIRFAGECETVDRHREKRHNDAKELLGIDPD